MKYTDEECERINHNYQIAVRNMNDRAWSAMLDSEKIASLQDVENKLAMDAGRIPSEVVTKEVGSTTYGAQDGNTLLIDAQSLQKDDFREVLDTLYHEDAHARDWVNSVFSDRQAALSPEERQVLAAPDDGSAPPRRRISTVTGTTRPRSTPGPQARRAWSNCSATSRPSPSTTPPTRPPTRSSRPTTPWI